MFMYDASLYYIYFRKLLAALSDQDVNRQVLNFEWFSNEKYQILLLVVETCLAAENSKTCKFIWLILRFQVISPLLPT